MGSLLILTADRLRAYAIASTSDMAETEPIGSIAKSEQNTEGDETEGESPEDGKGGGPTCVFCYDTRRNTTATECGHLFCWDCIVSCCDRRRECPLCRQPIRRQTLVRLEHYSPPPEDEDDGEDDEVVG